jgi:hypothetical protein
LRLGLDIGWDPFNLRELRSPDPAGEQGLPLAFPWGLVAVCVFNGFH